MAAARLVFGVGPVRELLRARARSIEVLYAAEGRAGRGARGDRGGRPATDPVVELCAEASRRGVQVELRARAELDALAGTGATHQGVIAVAGEYPYADIDDLLELARRRDQPPLVVALDGVKDPHNLGAIVRSAYVLGAHGVVLPADRAAQVTATVTKVSAGATEHLPIARVTNLARALSELKDAGLWLAAIASGPDARPLWELDAAGPTALVLGAEGTGVRPLTARTCDYQLEIPMAGLAVGSLNVSVAAGIALYEAARQRRDRGPTP